MQVPTVYLVDPGGQQWQLAVTDEPRWTATKVSGQAAVSSILIQDTSAAQTWVFTLDTNGDINLNPTSPQSVSTQILVNSPTGVEYAIQILNGRVEIVQGNFPVPNVATPRLVGPIPISVQFMDPLDVWYSAMENLTSEGDANSLNIPWLLGISVTVGNATTEAIGRNAVIFCEPEWGFDATGSGKGSMYGNGGMGTGEGGLYVNW